MKTPISKIGGSSYGQRMKSLDHEAIQSGDSSFLFMAAKHLVMEVIIAGHHACFSSPAGFVRQTHKMPWNGQGV